MSALVLTRIDPAKNMRRFYRLDIQPTLFGEFALIRECGRIGSGGQVREARCLSAEVAAEAMERMRQVKERWRLPAQHFGRRKLLRSHRLTCFTPRSSAL